ncbi:hypothetical protein D1007_36830 [Hordeum vulgare]|nr:hypothetical protein D1007_36830 [Hordeum vulgare]
MCVQPLCWRAEDTPWAFTDANMARRARRASQRAREANEALAAVDVAEAEYLAPHMLHGSGHHNRIVVDVISSHEGSIIDLTSIGTVRVTSSDEDE